MEERIIKLETLAALQDQTMATLSGELYAQQQEIGRLRQRIQQLETRLAGQLQPGETAGNERPPHW